MTTKLSKHEAYDILELARGSDINQIKRAYKILALRTHPDKNLSDPDASTKFRRVADAFTTLMTDDDHDNDNKYQYHGYYDDGDDDDGDDDDDDDDECQYGDDEEDDNYEAFYKYFFDYDDIDINRIIEMMRFNTGFPSHGRYSRQNADINESLFSFDREIPVFRFGKNVNSNKDFYPGERSKKKTKKEKRREKNKNKKSKEGGRGKTKSADAATKAEPIPSKTNPSNVSNASCEINNDEDDEIDDDIFCSWGAKKFHK